MNHTFLPGKDAPLEQTIEQIRKILKRADIEMLEPQYSNPATDCWSVYLQAKDCPQLYSNGKGISKNASLASGLGEFIERLATNFFFAPYLLEEESAETQYCHYPEEVWFPSHMKSPFAATCANGSKLLTERLVEFYDPDNDLHSDDLVDNNSSNERMGICALPFTCLSSGEVVHFPVSILNNIYVSNGMSAGNSRDEATAQSLSEIIERYVKNTILRDGISLPDIPSSLISAMPRIQSMKKSLNKQGFLMQFKDASLGGRFPVICVLLIDQTTGGVCASFGASLRFETAVERTVTELLQGRQLDKLSHLLPPCPDTSLTAETINLESHFINSEGLLPWRMFRDKPDFVFTPWDFKGSTREEVHLLRQLIAAQGFSIYRAEYLQYSLYTCRIIVPGMSEIYPIDELIYNNCNSGTFLRNKLLQLDDMTPQDLKELLTAIDELGETEQRLIAELIGVIFPQDSAWYNLRIGELKAMIFLALTHKEEAEYWCQWCIEHGLLSEQRKRLYRLLHLLLSCDNQGLNQFDYRQSLGLLYTHAEVTKAGKILSGEERFMDLDRGSCWSAVSSEHAALLHIYRRQNQIKAQVAA